MGKMKETTKARNADRQRIIENGEVFTNEREVNAMLDLVKPETERIDSRFLEPACGDGNFLSEILRRKLKVVTEKYHSFQSEWELNSVIAVSSIYGVELMEDNTQKCRNRLFSIFEREFYSKLFKRSKNTKVELIIKYLLNKNIICGDALKMVDSQNNPIVFAEWSFIGDKVQRRDYELSGLLADSKQSLMESVPNEQRALGQASIFDDESNEQFEDAGLIKSKRYPLINYMELGNSYD